MIVDINCANCTHSWETNTLTDPDPYLCHNCGLDNQTMKFEPEKLENWRKSQMKEEKIPGGKAEGLSLMDIAKHHKMPLKSIKVKLDQGIKTEMEHTTDKSIAREIVMDHIYEDPNYYTKLKQIETEGTCGYNTDVTTDKKLNTPGGLEEDGQKTSDKNMDDYKKQNNPSGKVKDPFGLNQYARELAMGLEEADPKTGTGKKPEGSSRRLYTDEDPSDTVKVKFSTKQDIIDTFSKASFKSKPHARQSQVINLIHQRVRAAYERAKDPDVKRRLKTALDYAEQKKEASKEKTERLKKENVAPNHDGKSAPFGSGYKKVNEKNGFGGQSRYRAIEKRRDKYYYIQDNPFAPGIRQEFGPYKTKEQAKKKMETFPPAQNYRDITENNSMELSKNLKNLIPELIKFMGENGLKIQPLPKIKFITDDEVNAKDPLGITAFYDPANSTIVLYTMGRHVKDILRSFAHEMVHHEQNLNKTIGTGKIKTTNTLEDDYLDKIEREAYEEGNIMFRNWTDSIKK
jgi:hypothetical protein